MAEAPAWARALVLEVCADADATTPRLSWLQRNRPTSSGVTRRSSGAISVSAGRDLMDARFTLLHELAHWLAPVAPRRRRRRVAHHDRAFYVVAFDLYRRYGVPAAVALAAESGRYPSSLAHARRLGVPGAEAAWRERRQLRARAAARPPMRVLVGEHRVRLVRDGRWTRCSVCGARIVGPLLRRMRRSPGRHILLGIA